MAEVWKRTHPGRTVLLIMVLLAWSALIVGRVVQLQVIRHEEYTLLALQRQLMTRTIAAPRGIIYDRRMDELATSITVGTLVAEPRRLKNASETARILASILDLDAADLKNKLEDPERQVFQIIRRRIDPEDEARIEALKLDGLYFSEESMRVYPNRDLASHALGFVNLNGDGGEGLELQYDSELKGSEGMVSFNVDARRNSFRGVVQRPPVQGHSLVLTLDRSIQYIADRELASGVELNHAAAGTAIVMESATGRILALSVYPNYNANTFNEYSPDRWRNRAVADYFEPGSTFKVVVAAAALEAGLARPDEFIDCQMGSISVANHVFHDHKPYGLLTFGQILEYSSNVGAVKLGLRLGEQGLHDAIRRFGFGTRTGVDLPGEIAGLVRDWSRWSALSIGAISFGQEVGVTAMQMLVGINSIANGGSRVRPFLVDRIITHDGELVHGATPEATRILSPRTAAVVRDAFEGVVLRGTGRAAALDGYRAAGKTGTAQKIVNRRYSDTRYLSSFIGFAPLPDPKITILVSIDEPRGKIYGGDVAAPVFRKIAQEALLQLRVPPDPSLPARPREGNPALALTAADFLPNATPVPPLGDFEDSDNAGGEDLIAIRVPSQNVLIPDFRGMGKRQVVARCRDLGIGVQAQGSGIAIRQMPPPGTPIAIGTTCLVTFGRSVIPGDDEIAGSETHPATAISSRIPRNP